LRTGANKDRLGWGGAFAVRNGKRETVGDTARLGKCLSALQVGASTNAKPFCAHFPVGVDLKGDPLIAHRVVEVNRYIALCCQPNANPKRPVCVVKQQDTAIAWRNTQNRNDFASRIDQLNSANPQTFGANEPEDGDEGYNPKCCQQ
jgi:hypothetical protein